MQLWLVFLYQCRACVQWNIYWFWHSAQLNWSEWKAGSTWNLVAMGTSLLRTHTHELSPGQHGNRSARTLILNLQKISRERNTHSHNETHRHTHMNVFSQTQRAWITGCTPQHKYTAEKPVYLSISVRPSVYASCLSVFLFIILFIVVYIYIYIIYHPAIYPSSVCRSRTF